jgi:hypothetical protein
MATAIIPKSEMRRNDNISVGYGEVPAVTVNGVTAWGLPGGRVTYSEEEALTFAIKLDKTIRQVVTSSQQLLSA